MKVCYVVLEKKKKQDVNFFLVDMRTDGYLYNSGIVARDILKTCSGKLNRAHPGLLFLPQKCISVCECFMNCILV